MARAWHLVKRPAGMPVESDFELREAELPPIGEGMVRVRNLWLSVDPYMRGRMNDVKSYIPPFQVGEPMDGGAVGEVVESTADGLAAGDLVMSFGGWRDEAVLDASKVNKLPDLGARPQDFLGNLGVPGATAYFGLLDVAEAKEGETVFVSAAAGAVGSGVVQIAKLKGMTVIGSAGGEEKCDFVRSLGADAAIDYRAGPILKSLREAAPQGIDVYFDNVGGDHLDAAFACARLHGRFAICGMIGGYNSREPAQFRYIMQVIALRLTMKGLLYGDFMPRLANSIARWARGSRAGRSRRGRPWSNASRTCQRPSLDCSAAPTPERCWFGSKARCRPRCRRTGSPCEALPFAVPMCRA